MEEFHAKVREHAARNAPTLLTSKDISSVSDLRKLPAHIPTKKMLALFPWFKYIYLNMLLAPTQFSRERNLPALKEALAQLEKDREGSCDAADEEEDSSNSSSEGYGDAEESMSAAAAGGDGGGGSGGLRQVASSSSVPAGLCRNVLWAIRLVLRWSMDKPQPDALGGGWVNSSGTVEQLSIERLQLFRTFSILLSSSQKLMRFMLWLKNTKGMSNVQTLRNMISSLSLVIKWEMSLSHTEGMDTILRSQMQRVVDHLNEQRVGFSKEANLFRRHKRDQIELERIGKWATTADLKCLLARVDEVSKALQTKVYIYMYMRDREREGKMWLVVVVIIMICSRVNSNLLQLLRRCCLSDAFYGRSCHVGANSAQTCLQGCAWRCLLLTTLIV